VAELHLVPERPACLEAQHEEGSEACQAEHDEDDDEAPHASKMARGGVFWRGVFSGGAFRIWGSSCAEPSR